jgi:hypothetical protein
MKLFKCTVVTYPNTYYVETLLIVAANAKNAEEQIKAARRDKYNPNPNIEYTSPLTEITIDTAKQCVMKVGFGHGDNDYGLDD